MSKDQVREALEAAKTWIRPDTEHESKTVRAGATARIAQIDAALSALTAPPDASTHWDGCWRHHHACAVARLEAAPAVERVRAETWREAAELLDRRNDYRPNSDPAEALRMAAFALREKAAALTPKPAAPSGEDCTCGYEYVEGMPVGPSGDPNCPVHRDVMHGVGIAPAPTPEAAQAPTREAEAKRIARAHVVGTDAAKQIAAAAIADALAAKDAEIAKVREELERWKLRVEVEKKNLDAAHARADAAEQRIAEAVAILRAESVGEDDGVPCWCDDSGDGPHDNECFALRGVWIALASGRAAEGVESGAKP